MAGKAVAVTGEVTPKPVDDPLGTWQPGPIIYETHDHLTIGGQPVIFRASCTFTFLPNSTTTKPPDQVILSAGATVLRGEQIPVLVNDDSATGAAGNQLRVETSNKLRSA